MPLILGTNSIKDTGYDVDNSLRFNDGSSDYLNRTFSAGNRTTWSVSVWIKRSSLGANMRIFTYGSGGDPDDRARFLSNDTIEFQCSAGGELTTTRVFRDTSSWYHFVFVYDSTNGTAGNRMRMYVNGVEETVFTTDTNPSLNLACAGANVNGEDANIGRDGYGGGEQYFDGYMTEFLHIDGTALSPTDVGEFDEDSGIWKPIDVSGLTFGTNGFYLDFEDSSALGNDVSGNDNDFTVNNLTAIDSVSDVPTNNFATGNPLEKGSPTYSNGNLTSTSGSWLVATSTIASSSGKYYFEVKSLTSGTQSMIGIVKTDDLALSSSSILFCGRTENSIGYYHGGTKYINDVETSYGNSYTTNDIIGVAMDLDNLKLYFSKNGVWQNSGDPTSGATGTGAINIPSAGFYHFAVSTNGSTSDANYGNPPFTISSGNSDGNGMGNFEYAVPSGYFALCTSNLAEHG